MGWIGAAAQWVCLSMLNPFPVTNFPSKNNSLLLFHPYGQNVKYLIPVVFACRGKYDLEKMTLIGKKNGHRERIKQVLFCTTIPLVVGVINVL